jgi:protein-disulfide isomerase
MRDRFELLLTTALSLSAVSIGVVLIHREFYSAPPAAQQEAPPTYVSNWKSMIANGRTVGDDRARVKIIEFSDLECPFCRRFDQAVRVVQRKYPGDVAMVFVHFPLTQHRFAMPAARAVECANQTGQFAQLVALTFDKQDSLGLKSWNSFAQEAGVPDTLRFSRCLADTSQVARIESGLSLGRKLGIHATPTILINGWRPSVAPAEPELSKIVASIIAGENPFPDGARKKAP